ncbi:MAG: magnesium transporter [Candidatus Brocadiaceae bacterium]|nr:magnesium transporter [Candidatus Brocadiaceae bacterium]
MSTEEKQQTTTSERSEEETPERPWEELSRLIKTEEREQVNAYLASLPSGEVARAVSRLDEEVQTELIAKLKPEHAARVLEEMHHVQATDILEDLAPATAAAIIQELSSAEQADLIGDLDQDDAEAILDELHPEEAESVRELARYEDNEAGGLMITELLAFPARFTTQQVVDDIRTKVEEYKGYESQYLYVVGAKHVLFGVLPLRDLLLASREARISSIMVRNPLSLSHHATLDEIGDFFDKYNYYCVPIIDDNKRLLGVVTRADFAEAWGDTMDDDFRKSRGLVEEELRTMPILLRSRRRLAWLSVNILLNIIAASIIAMHEDTLSAVIALAVFLPIISDMSGCSGNQAVAVSLRELTLGLVRTSEIFRVLSKEICVGIINGIALGFLLGAVAWAWKGNPYLGIVVGIAMAANNLLAVCIGGIVPLLLKHMKKDPALASGPILTTITDMCGFFFALTLASVLLNHLI